MNIGRGISAGAGHNGKGSGHVLSAIEGDFVSQRKRFPRFLTNMKKRFPVSHPLFNDDGS